MGEPFEQRWESKIEEYAAQLAAEPPLVRDVREQSNAHRRKHGRECDVYPSSPMKGRFLQALVHATRSRRVLEIGCGLGYSAIWMATAMDFGGVLETVEASRAHARLARENFALAGVADRVRILEGKANAILPSLTGPYDLVFEDAAYGADPPYREDMVRLLRIGGMLVTSNWFTLESYLGGGKDEFAKAGRGMKKYADRLFRDPRLVGVLVPWVWWGVSTKVRE